MKLFHLSDLHIGKKVSKMSLLDEQRKILDDVVEAVRDHRPEGVILAGDIYDNTVPSAEAVALFDDFLVKLQGLGTKVFVISGNHDSPERIAFASRIMDRSGVHLSRVYDGTVEPVVLSGGDVEVAMHMLPFVKPATVRYFFSDEKIESYNDAVRVAVEHMSLDKSKVNVLVAHQYITDAERSDSEEVSVGGLENVDSSVFDAFDYVALGHLHRPQSCGRDTVRYSGSPLKYSFSEVKDRKSITVVDVKGKGDVRVDTIPLVPAHDWHDLRGTYDELAAKSFWDGTPYCEDFVRITLTDEEDVPDAVGKLRSIYHNLMELQYDNTRTRSGYTSVGGASDVERKSPLEIFAELYAKQNGKPMSEDQEGFVTKLVESIWEN